MLRILALGAIGYAGQSSLFYLSLQRGTAATSILLFYAYPALVCVIGWLALGERRPARRTALALGLSAAGTATVAATSGPLTVSALGVACALGSALVFALYLLAGQRLGGAVRRDDDRRPRRGGRRAGLRRAGRRSPTTCTCPRSSGRC